MSVEEESSEWKIPPLQEQRTTWKPPDLPKSSANSETDWAIPPLRADSLGETYAPSERSARFPRQRVPRQRQLRWAIAILSLLLLAAIAIATWLFFVKSAPVPQPTSAAPVESTPSQVPEVSPSAFPSVSVRPAPERVATESSPLPMQKADTLKRTLEEANGISHTQILEFVRRFVQANQSHDVNGTLRLLHPICRLLR